MAGAILRYGGCRPTGRLILVPSNYRDIGLLMALNADQYGTGQPADAEVVATIVVSAADLARVGMIQADD